MKALAQAVRALPARSGNGRRTSRSSHPSVAVGLATAVLLLAATAAGGAPRIARVTTPGGAPVASAAPGAELVLHGSGFGAGAGAVWLDRGGYGQVAEVVDWNAAAGTIRLRVPAPNDLGPLRLIVRDGSEGSDPYPFTLSVTPPSPPPAPEAPLSPPPVPPAPPTPPRSSLTDPIIRAVNVLGGRAITGAVPGTRVLISGARFGRRGEIRFNGAPATAVTVWNPNYIVATLPNAPGAGPITLHRSPGGPDEATGFGPIFTILPPPVVTGYSRGGIPIEAAAAGEEITIHGADLGASGEVRFRGALLAVRSWTLQAVVVVLPPVPGSGPVTLTLNPRTGAEITVQGPALNVYPGD
jgi:hypothetical protein